MGYKTYTFQWEGIEIEARYNPKHFDMIAHLEIRSINPENAPLPVTGTGYRSHFHPRGVVEAHDDDVIAVVREWLNEEAKSKNWLDQNERFRQADLFDCRVIVSI